MITRLQKNRFYTACFALGVIIGATINIVQMARAIVVSTPELPIQTGEVTSLNILDGTIVNADVSSTAGIATSKLATSTALDLLTNGTQTFTGTKTFGTLPTLPAGTPSGNQAVSYNYLSANFTTTAFAVTSTDAVATNTPMYIKDFGKTTATSSQLNGAQSAVLALGCSSNNNGNPEGGAMKYVAAKTDIVDKIGFKLRNVGSATTSLLYQIRADNNGVPSSTILASATVPTANVSTTMSFVDALLPTYFSFASGTTYWLMASNTISGICTTYYELEGTASTQFGGVAYSYFGGAWATTTSPTNINYEFRAVPTVGYAAPAAANSASSSNSFVGFSTTAVSANEQVTITGGGVVMGLNGLSIGQQYYLGNASGTIQPAAGSTTRKIGIAISSSSLFITNTW